MKREHQVIAMCILTTCTLTLLIMMLAFFGVPQTTWRLVRRFLWILGLSELCAVALGYGLGRYATSSVNADMVEQQSRLRLYLSETGHELRTPLAVMHGSIDILRVAVPPADLAALSVLDGLSQEITRLLDLVQKVLLLARLDVVRRPVTHVVDLSEALHSIARWARTRAPATPLHHAIQPGLSAALDEAAFLEAMRNLIDNALRYAPGAAIRITGRRRGDAIMVEIADEGPGMDAEDAALAFERYYRGSRAVSVPGSGLGLSIVKAMAERHGGTAALESRPGEGTCVTVAIKHAAP